MVLLGFLLLYVVAGLVTALAFVSVGVARVMPQPVSVSLGARIMLVPGATLLWPYVLWRWLKVLGAR